MIIPQVSVVIPIYNASPFLDKAVNSALALSEVGEVILVDDGSTDNSYEICLSLQDFDSRIKVLFHDGHKNKGASHSRNLGILNASFPFVAFLDADDIYYPNRFSESLQILNSDEKIQGVFGKALRNNLVYKSQKVIGVPSNISSKDLLGYVLDGGYFHTNTLTVRKSFFNIVGLFNPKLWPGEEVELWIRMAFLKGICPIQADYPVAEYRIHGNNLSFSGFENSRFAFWVSIFQMIFFKRIGFKNRFIILKKLIKSAV
ncbi:MAG: glycosyltransferase family 2 protein [Algoriphagus aquaeductus]|uniref:glycosyltransferase family 2 protein n=1 Tax=Algoriphagus aquaeductus TaxID=475299 RepID=UPI00387A47AF